MTWPAGCVKHLPADWHVTLHFIGNVDTQRLVNLAEAVAVPFQPFELVLDQPVVWPRGVAVLLATEVPRPLRTLHDRLGHALRGLDLPVESRPYLPHVTLARRAEAAIAPKAFAPLVWWVRRFALVISTGDRDKRYRMIRQYL